MRAAIALACVLSIAAAIALIVRLDAVGERVAVQAQINQDGQVVGVDDTAPADPQGNGQAVCPPLSIAMAGALTGPDVDTGTNIRNGVQLAVEKHNSANPGCQVQLKEFDTGGDPQRVNAFAPQIVADAYTVGLIGPTFSGVAQATGAFFQANGLATATASASRSALSEQGWTTFFRGVPSDELQGRAVAAYLINTVHYEKVCLVSDTTTYGTTLAAAAAGKLTGRIAPACQFSLMGDQQQRDHIVGLIKAAQPDAVVYGGSYAESGEILRHMRRAGVSAAFIAVQGRTDPQSLRDDDWVGEDTLMFCPCGPGPEWFRKEYQARFGRVAGAYSAEGYDLATIMLRGIDAGMLTRPQLLGWMRRYDGQGLARRYQWTDTGELTRPTVWLYKAR